MTTILIKKKDTAGAPAAGDLTNAAGGAEIAVNTATKRIYSKDSGGTIIEMGTYPSSMAVQGALSATGATNLNGNVTLGDASADNITVSGTITSNLIFTDNTYDIGASGATRPRNLYLAGDATIGGSIAATTLDLTNLEVTNIKAKDGTASITLADSTGVASFTANPVLSGGTANGVAYLNGSKVLTTGSALTFDGSSLKTTGSVLAGGAVPASGAGVTLAYNGSTTGYIYSYDWSASTYKALYVAGNSLQLVASGGTQIQFDVNGSEQMRLTSTGLGIGTSSPAGKLDVTGRSYFRASGSNTVLTLLNTSGGDGNIVVTGTSTTMNYSFNTYSTGSALYIQNDGNVGIGTSSPSAKLEVSGSSSSVAARITTTVGGAGNRYAQLQLMDGSTQGSQIYQNFNGGTLAIRNNTAAGSIVLFTNDTTNALTYDSSGNLGLGVTPSGWNSAFKSLDIGTRSAGFAGSDDATYISTNAYNNSGWKFKGTSTGGYRSGLYQQFDGSHQWFYGNTGTAGNAITFTQAMTLDAGGKLGIGITSPVAQLHSSAADAGNYQLGVSGTTKGFRVITNSTTTKIQGVDNTLSTSYQPLTLGGSYLSFETNGTTEAARIDSSGRFGIGTTSPAGPLQVVGGSDQIRSGDGTTTSFLGGSGSSGYTGTLTNHPFVFYTNSTERARIDSSGNLLVAQTAIGNGGTLSVNGTLSIGTTTSGTQSSMSKDGMQLTSSISTSATTIFTSMIQGLSSAAVGYFLIYGHDNNSAGFFDVVVARPSGTATVLSSTSTVGSPSARTYTVSTNALQLAMASGTYSVNVRCTTMGYPF